MASDWGRHQFSDWRGEWTLCSAEEFRALDPKGTQPLSASEAADHVDGWADDSSSWLKLLSLYEELSACGFGPPSKREIRDVILPFLRQAFEWERAFAVPSLSFSALPRCEREGVVTARSVLEKVAAAAPKVLKNRVDLSFVEIVLQDENGNPVAGESYELKLSDGSLRTGKLDGKGTVRLAGISMGECTVKFPERDRRDFL